MPSYRRRGYAKEAVARIISAVKNKEFVILEKTIREGVVKVVQADIKCIETKINVDNILSMCVAKSFGFNETARLTYFKKKNDQYIDGKIYDLLIDG